MSNGTVDSRTLTAHYLDRGTYGKARWVVTHPDGSLVMHKDNYGHMQITYWRSESAATKFATTHSS